MITVPGFEGRRVAVFGLGRSGLTAARALRAGGAEPVLWDDSLSSRLQAEAEGFTVEDLSRADWSGFAALILSPGAPLTHPSPHWTVQMAKDAGVRVMGDTGSLALGGALGAMAVATKHELVLAIVGGLFVVEALSVMIQVAYFKATGKRIFLMAPIHHHFEKMGWAESTVVVRFWIVAAMLALVGLSTLKLR